MKTKKLRRALLPLLLPVSALLAMPAQGEDLMEIYRMAAENDPELRAAAASRAAVAEELRQSEALYGPSVSLGASYTRNRDESKGGFFSSPPIYYTNKGISLNLSQAIYRKDLLSQKAQSEARLRQAEAQFAAAEQALALKAAERYFNVLAAQDNLEFALAEKEAISRQLEQTKQRFEVGLIAITDVHESQAAHDMAVAAEISAQNNLAMAHEALREVTGHITADVAPLSERIELISPEPADVEQWIERALESNLGIVAARAGVEAAHQQLELARAGRSPNLDLVASHNYADTGGLFGDRTSNSTVVGLQLSLPLYQGGGISARIRQARHGLEQAREELEKSRRQVQRATSDAYLTVLATISQVKALEQAVVSSTSALEATEAGYEVGTRTTVDVLNVRRNLYRAQRDYARARYDYILSTLRLKQAAGILGEEDLRRINGWLGK